MSLRKWFRTQVFLAPMIVLAGATRPAVAEGEQVTASAAASIAKAREETQRLLTDGKIPGLTIAVGVGDRIVWSEAFGMADREAAIPATVETTYRIGSVSKLLTIAALGVLYEGNKIDLDAPIRKYFPDYPDADGQITARRLAGHLAGIRHYNGFSEAMSQQHCDSVTEALQVFQKDPLIDAPGNKYLYSSYGYVLLSAVIEKAAGGPFLAYVKETVLTPLKLNATGPETVGQSDPKRAAYYVEHQGNVVRAPSVDVSCRWAAGGYVSTAPDLARFLLAHVNQGWLKRETVELLFTPLTLSNGETKNVGLGWRVAKDDAGRRFVHHGGTIAGGRAFVLLYPEEKVAVAICCNFTGAAFAEKEVQRIATSFLPAR